MKARSAAAKGASVAASNLVRGNGKKIAAAADAVKDIPPPSLEELWTMFTTIVSGMDAFGLIALSFSGLALIHSIALAGMRHNTYEDHGIFDTFSELLKYSFVFFVTLRCGNLNIPEFSWFVYLCIIMVTSYMLYSTYMKYVSGPRNPFRDLKGHVYIVTGSNTGIGFETALRLCSMNATVILACRNLEKAEHAKTEILNETNCDSAHVIPLHLDLCDFDSVSSFVKEFLKLRLPLHGLVNNAGIMSEKRMPTTVSAPCANIITLMF